ncbi:aldo/keto reductase [Bradyrhizobium sp. 24]|uniref:aldo/keto reductase n=1 Tax=unclassified Bradyrhizobium TaxID=2631580 RepID=UPI002112991A|nr:MULTISPECIES: aldo/keto reductase [unclassified Bradyrhizobium]MCK1303763.1 aldo/keto reductase [Bradyrhizobium sp. 37]MCK1380883.1 aldo/keto reductase [Bradyrhizobium sp. 24]MCK1772358.1 aldo/keto reductase [Bradyrhizobium sp. 134]
MPRIGLGTWKLEGDAAMSAVLAALEAGYEHIDTASRYGNEEAIGKAIARGGVARSQLFLTSKVWWTDLEPERVLASVKRSVESLDCEYLDLLLVHWPNPEVDLKKTLAAMAEAKAMGVIRNIGLSNFPLRTLSKAVQLSCEPIAALQCEYHPYLDQSKLISFCRDKRITFVAYAPFGSGALLSDPAITDLAVAHGTTAADIVLEWLMQQEGVAAVPRSSNPQRIAANLRRGTISLSPEEMAAITALHRPDGRVFSPSWAPDWDE